MDIKTSTHTAKPNTRPAATTKAATPQATVSAPEWEATEPKDSWAGAALSVAGGGAALLGAVTGNGLLSAGGSIVSTVGMTMTAAKYQVHREMNTAAVVSFVGGGALLGAAALTTLSPPQPMSKSPGYFLLEKALNRGF